uniref:Rab interacting lysosomal protein like 2 n=1 Tax=Athene cunicularia TaxID=194338 RepID=A0A663MEI2_ATHCN
PYPSSCLPGASPLQLNPPAPSLSSQGGLHAGPRVPAALARLQFRIVRVLEMLEALVSESSLVEEQLRMERDSLRREVEELRAQGARGGLSLGPDKMVIDLTDPSRPRFTLQELRDVLQERNQLKAQLLVVQEELQCYKSQNFLPPPACRRGRECIYCSFAPTISGGGQDVCVLKPLTEGA